MEMAAAATATATKARDATRSSCGYAFFSLIFIYLLR